MNIRKAQTETYSKHLEDAFVARMVQHLLGDFPKQLEAQGLGEHDLEPFVRRGMADAEKYDVVYEADVERYVECMALLGPKFDRDKKLPWAGEILRRDDADGEEKVDQITEHLIFGMQEPPI